MRGIPHVLARLRKPMPAIGQSPADCVHAENKWRLLRYRLRAAGVRYATPILLVPSLINRWQVLDLMPARSFVEYLLERGHNVFVVDWGTPSSEDRLLTFDEICDGYLGRAIRRTALDAKQEQVHLLGYCMGGTLTAIHAAARPERIATLTQLAAPVNFEDGGILSAWMRSPSFDVDALVDGFGNLPWQIMQCAFHLMRPTLTPSKLVHLLDRDWDAESLDGFLALERWGNDNVSFPGACFRTYVRDLYERNLLVRGEFRLSGRPARLQSIRCPVHVITFEHDNIVPWRSAAAMLEHVSCSDKAHLHLAGGHVGALVANSAADRLWKPLSDWWVAHDKPLTTRRVRESRRATHTPITP